MIKLKDIILEYIDEFGETRPVITKVEEDEAFQIIVRQLVPKLTQDYNYLCRRWSEPEIKPIDILRKLRKVKVEHYTNGMEILWVAKLKLTNIEFKTHKLAFRKKDLNRDDVNVFEIGYWDIAHPGWGDLGWVLYDIYTARKGINFDDQG